MSALNRCISECNQAQGTPGVRVYSEMLSAAVDDWTQELVEVDNQDEKTRLQGAIRRVKYLLRRIEEPPIPSRDE